MTSVTRERLIELAERYETKDFLKKDPSQFMHRYEKKEDQEIIAFIAANLAFGKREQILSHVETVCKSIKEYGNDSPAEWISSASYTKLFRKSDESFYRMMSHNTMRLFCRTLESLLEKYGSLEKGVKLSYEKNGDLYLHHTIASLFPKECAIVCHGKTSSAKRLQMFLRWMVRNNSPVDLGLWSIWYSKEKLLMPLDTHVMQEAVKLNLIALTPGGKIPSPTLKLAVSLTKEMEKVFPGDPVRADYALFGLGVDETS